MTEQPDMAEAIDKSLVLMVREAQAELERAERSLIATVAQMRDRGWSWDRISKVFGVSRQAAWERFHLKVKGTDA